MRFVVYHEEMKKNQPSIKKDCSDDLQKMSIWYAELFAHILIEALIDFLWFLVVFGTLTNFANRHRGINLAGAPLHHTKDFAFSGHLRIKF